jgi:hypothetical protein
VGEGTGPGSHILLPPKGEFPSLQHFAMRSEDSLTRSCQDVVPSWGPCVQGSQSKSLWDQKWGGCSSLQGSCYLHPAGDHLLGAVAVLTNLPLTFRAGPETVRGRWTLGDGTCSCFSVRHS